MSRLARLVDDSRSTARKRGVARAYGSPIGRELRDDEKRLIADPRVPLLRGAEIVPVLGGLAG